MLALLVRLLAAEPAPQKPVAFRQRTQTSVQGLRIAAELDTFPLHARYLEALR